MDGFEPRDGDLYIELMKKVLTDFHRLHIEEYVPLSEAGTPRLIRAIPGLGAALRRRDYALCKRTSFSREKRMVGGDWPLHADTMIGMKRLENIEYCVRTVIEEGIPGDLIETGVWRGGATIFMRALLEALGDRDRKVWVADSFAGLPKPDGDTYPVDRGDKHHTVSELAISLATVQRNFRKYDLLDERVKFLKGWFSETLPTAPIETLAVARLDGDMYESTMNALDHLYPKLSRGGFLIVDDWGVLPGCKAAVVDYREAHGVEEEIHDIDRSGVYWRRETTPL